MIIGIDARSLATTPRTGVGEFTYELLSHLLAQDTTHTYVLFSNAWKDLDEPPFTEHSHVTWVTTRIPNKLFHAVIALFGHPHLDTYVAKRAGVPHIDVWMSPNFHFTALSKQVKHALIVHDLSFHHYPSFFSKKGRIWHWAVHPKKQVERAHAIMTPSESTARDVAEVYGVKASTCTILYPGVCSHITSPKRRDPADVARAYDLPDEFLLYLGTLEPRKNIDGLLDAYQQSSYLKKKMPIIFAGALGYKGSQYQKRIEQTEGARYIGYVDERDKYGLYTLAHTFVYPSLYEGFGLPVLESLTCGTPVITSHRSSLPEVVGEAGIMVHPNNTRKLQTCMEDMVHDGVLHQQYAKKTTKKAQMFSWESAAKKCLELLERI